MHPWFKKFEKRSSGEVNLNANVLNRLKSYKGISHLKRAAMNMLVKMSTEEEVKELKSTFQQIDKDGSGFILATELAEILKARQMNMSNKEIAEMISEMDYAGNGKINYSEFISATINVKTFLSETRLRAIFQQFDTDSTGFITEDNLYYAFQKLGQEIARPEIKKLISQHDLKRNNQLDYEEFRTMFYNTSDKPFGSDGPSM